MDAEDQTAWPAGSGEMARRTRDHAWADTPLGASQTWPERLRAVVDMVLASPEVSSVAIGPAKLLIYNDAAAGLYGERHPGALGRPLAETFADSYPAVESLYDRAFAGEAVQVRAQPLAVSGHGGGEAFDAGLTPVRAADGTVFGVHMVGFEVGARTRTEAALRDSEARFRAFTTASADVIYRMGPDWSQMHQLEGRAFLLDTDEPSGDWLDRYIHPDDQPTVRAAINRAIRTKTTFELEHRVIRADGALGCALSRAVPILGADGEIKEWLGAATDVTDSKRAEAVLRESEERQVFLLKLSDALRPLAQAKEIQGQACRLLAQHLDVDRAYYVEVDEARGLAHVDRDYVREGVVSLAGEHRLTDFGWSAEILRRGECHVVSDTHTSPLVPAADRPASAALGIVACMGAPLLKGGTLVGAMCVSDARPRDWAGREVDLLRDVAERIWAAIERARAEAAFSESEERLRQFGEASQDVLWIRDADTFQWEYLTPAFEAIYGLDRAAALRGDNMANWLALVLPEDREHAEASLNRVRDGEWVTFEYRIRRPADGDVRWLRDTDFPIEDASGRVASIGGIGHDITALKATEGALAAAEVRQRALLEGIPQLVWRAVDGGEWTWASPQWTEFTGQAEADSHDYGWLATVHPADRERVCGVWEGAVERGEFHADYRVRHAEDGRYRWFQTRATPVRNPAGEVVEWLGACTDVQDMRSLQERQRVLLHELQHRVRNTLAVVRSIASSTGETSETVEDFASHLGGRLSALARTQMVLTRTPGEGVDLETMVREELLAQAAREAQIEVEGPDVRLSPKAAEVLTLAIHELATNAVKYGALATSAGLIRVGWSTSERRERVWLTLTWEESGVRVAATAPRREGFGTELIETRVPYELRGRGVLDFRPGGVRCQIEFPLTPGESMLQTDAPDAELPEG